MGVVVGKRLSQDLRSALHTFLRNTTLLQMDDSDPKDNRLRGYTSSGCKITLVSSRRSSKISHLKNYVDTSSQSKGWGKGLSPFLVGPADLYDGMLTGACSRS